MNWEPGMSEENPVYASGLTREDYKLKAILSCIESQVICVVIENCTIGKEEAIRFLQREPLGFVGFFWKILSVRQKRILILKYGKQEHRFMWNDATPPKGWV